MSLRLGLHRNKAKLFYRLTEQGIHVRRQTVLVMFNQEHYQWKVEQHHPGPWPHAGQGQNKHKFRVRVCDGEFHLNTLRGFLPEFLRAPHPVGFAPFVRLNRPPIPCELHCMPIAKKSGIF